jgi:hypothetical protein
MNKKVASFQGFSWCLCCASLAISVRAAGFAQYQYPRIVQWSGCTEAEAAALNASKYHPNGDMGCPGWGSGKSGGGEFSLAKNTGAMFRMNLWHTDTELEAQVEQAVRFTSAQPEGLRSLFSWTLHRHIAFDEADSIMPSSYYKTCAKYDTKKNMECEPGNVTGAATVCNFPGPWWEHGTQFVKARFQQFAQKFHEAGGVVDNFVLDTEIGESLWEIGSLYTNNKEKDDCITARWRAIEVDTRFPALLKRLVAAGFNLTNSTSPLVSTVANWRHSDNYQIWDSVVQQMVAEAWNATLAPFKTLYPKMQSWNYDFVHRRAGQETYDTNTHPEGKYGGGAHVGTHQSEEHYFQMEPAAWNRTRINGSMHTYTATCFNAARMEVNKVRASRLGAPNVPIAPWIASRAWASNTSAAAHRNQCYNNDFYSEVLFHYLAIGVEVSGFPVCRLIEIHTLTDLYISLPTLHLYISLPTLHLYISLPTLHLYISLPTLHQGV